MLPADSPFAPLPAPGPHPATAELRAYAAGTLSPADEHRIEAHSLDCERCAELLEGFSMSDAATTDHALAELRARLQARVADDALAPALLPTSRPLWPRLAAAAALLGVAAGGIWGWERYAPAPATTARIEVAAPVTSPNAAVAAAETAPPEAADAAMAAGAATAPPASVSAPPSPAAAADVTIDSKADYAIVTPTRQNAARLRTISPPPPPIAAMPQAEVAATPVATAPSAADMARSEPALTGDAAASSRPSELARAARPAADSVPNLGEVAVAVRSAKAKAAASTASALVANSPMPAAMTIAPAPVTGTPALRDYLRQEAADFELEEGAKPQSGTVRLRFVVGADGKLSNLQVVRSLRADYDEEALRMICEGPAWRPGIAGGRRAALPVELTVSF